VRRWVIIALLSMQMCALGVASDKSVWRIGKFDKSSGEFKSQDIDYASAKSDPVYREVNDYPQMFTHTLREIEHFFSVYKSLEGKKTEIAGWDGVEAARRIIGEGQARLHR